MPQESLVTPHLADFVEQMLEPLPGSNVFGSSVNVRASFVISFCTLFLLRALMLHNFAISESNSLLL